MRNVIFTATALAFVALSNPALADCTCVTSSPANSSVVGKIVSATGQVLFSGKTGFETAKTGSKLVSGSQISTGAGATANISVGEGCKLSVPENSEVSLTPVNGTEGNICLELVSEYGQAAGAGTGSVSPIVPLVIVAGAGGIAIAVSGGSSSASP